MIDIRNVYYEMVEEFFKLRKIRRGIKNSIIAIDKTKNSLIRDATEKISRDLGYFFSEFITHSSAFFVYKKENIFRSGVSIRVALGPTLAISPMTLSGGQKTLLSLSTILAMISFQPSPIYIMDEIDAALDVEHTLNLSGALSRNLKRCQFIVVSLKEKMFTNAPVIFMVNCKQGISNVRRIENIP